MGRLIDKEFWDAAYEQKAFQNERPSLTIKLEALVKRLLGEKIVEYISNYADYLLWHVIYQKYLPKTKGAKALEVGSAPGSYLVRLSQTFGFVPYGVEYSESGVELNRKLFTWHNINPDNVILADFLSDEFHQQYKGYFDIVISRGFIEHFTDVEDIINKHINLLTKGGCLVVSIPNLKRANYILTWIFNREEISLCNINIMQKGKFSELFDKERLSTLFCDYYGTFSFFLFNTERNSPTRFLLGFCHRLQLILNMVFRLLFKDKGAESRLFSPYLIFIGLKRE